MLISKIIYWISRGFFMICFVFSLFVTVFSLLSFLETSLGWDLPFVRYSTEHAINNITITLPFTETYIRFQQGFIMLFMIGFFIFYSWYFYALSQFFKIFTEQQVFTEASIKKLRIFTQLNFIPIVFSIFFLCIDNYNGVPFKMDSEYILPPLHLLIALFIYLYLDLIKKGKIVQEENDLMI